jgi:hypothetical protein
MHQMIYLLTTTSVKQKYVLNNLELGSKDFDGKPVVHQQPHPGQVTPADIERGIISDPAERNDLEIDAPPPKKYRCTNDHSIFACGKLTKCKDCELSNCHIC